MENFGYGYGEWRCLNHQIVHLKHLNKPKQFYYYLFLFEHFGKPFNIERNTSHNA